MIFKKPDPSLAAGRVAERLARAEEKARAKEAQARARETERLARRAAEAAANQAEQRRRAKIDSEARHQAEVQAKVDELRASGPEARAARYRRLAEIREDERAREQERHRLAASNDARSQRTTAGPTYSQILEEERLRVKAREQAQREARERAERETRQQEEQRRRAAEREADFERWDREDAEREARERAERSADQRQAGERNEAGANHSAHEEREVRSAQEGGEDKPSGESAYVGEEVNLQKASASSSTSEGTAEGSASRVEQGAYPKTGQADGDWDNLPNGANGRPNKTPRAAWKISLAGSLLSATALTILSYLANLKIERQYPPTTWLLSFVVICSLSFAVFFTLITIFRLTVFAVGRLRGYKR